MFQEGVWSAMAVAGGAPSPSGRGGHAIGRRKTPIFRRAMAWPDEGFAPKGALFRLDLPIGRYTQIYLRSMPRWCARLTARPSSGRACARPPSPRGRRGRAPSNMCECRSFSGERGAAACRSAPHPDLLPASGAAVGPDLGRSVASRVPSNATVCRLSRPRRRAISSPRRLLANSDSFPQSSTVRSRH